MAISPEEDFHSKYYPIREDISPRNSIYSFFNPRLNIDWTTKAKTIDWNTGLRTWKLSFIGLCSSFS
jgi:hypothetical protein